MRLPWKKKSETELKLEELENSRRLQEARLKAAEIDDEVIKAQRIISLFETIYSGSRNEEERKERLRFYAMQAGIDHDWLKEDVAFEKAMKKLDDLDDAKLAKLEKVARMQKDHKRLLGMK